MNRFYPLPTLCLLLALTSCDTPAEAPAVSRDHELPTEDPPIGTMEEMIVGTWKDFESENIDTYESDNTVTSEINEVMMLPLSELGFGEGSISLHVKAKANGHWTLEGDELTLKFAAVDDVFVGEASLNSDSLSDTLGPDFVAEFVKEFPQEIKTSLPSTICGQEISRTVVSVDDSVLVTRDESDGEVERQKRVSR